MDYITITKLNDNKYQIQNNNVLTRYIYFMNDLHHILKIHCKRFNFDNNIKKIYK